MKISDLDLKLLRVFAAVVAGQGYAGAQARLGLSPSTISGHMSTLETRLGLRLCERGRGGFRLTQPGEAVYAEVRQLLAATEIFESHVGELRGELAGNLRMGLVPNTITDPAFSLSHVLARFDRREHMVHFDLQIAAPPVLEQGLLEGRLQLAIFPVLQRIAGLDYQPLYEESHSLYCGAGHPLFSRDDDEIDEAELIASRFVARSYLHQRDVRSFGAETAAATVENVEAQAMLILSGGYLGYLPCHYAASWEAGGELRAIRRCRQRTTLDYRNPFVLVTRAGAAVSLALQCFADDLRAELSFASIT